MSETLKVLDGIPARLRGIRKGTVSVVEFVHRCCGCGLRHDVRISHNGKDPGVDITFDRRMKIMNEEKTSAAGMSSEDFKNKTMLVKLEKHQLSTSVTDKATSAEVRERKGVAQKSGSWHKKLFTSGYEQIRKIMNEVTKYHKAITVPYDDDGFAMLKASLYEEYKETIDGLIEGLSVAVDEFVTNLDAIIESDRKALGDTFDLADYPSGADIRESVCIVYKFQSLPNLNGVQINSFSMKELIEQNESRLKAVMEAATAKPLEQLLDLIGKVQGTLGDPDKIFRNSLVGNMQECLDNIEHLNLTGSPEITKAAGEAKKLLSDIGEDLDALRKDKEFRSEVANKAAIASDRIGKIAAPKLKK